VLVGRLSSTDVGRRQPVIGGSWPGRAVRSIGIEARVIAGNPHMVPVDRPVRRHVVSRKLGPFVPPHTLSLSHGTATLLILSKEVPPNAQHQSATPEGHVGETMVRVRAMVNRAV
jgi:hypothetical protein